MTRRMRSDERGVVLVQLALMSMVLIGFCALSIDYGAMWVARSQAQNVADAAALASATALAFDATILDTTTVDLATAYAKKTASRASIWGKTPTVIVDLCDSGSVSADCPAPERLPLPQSRTYFSATATVFMNGEQGSEKLPTYFARVFGVSSQGVRASATAAVVPANTVTCVWPVAIADRFGKRDNTTTPDTYSNRTYAGEMPPSTPDEYVPVPYAMEGELSDESYQNVFQIQDEKLAPNVTDLTLEDLVAAPAVAGNPWPKIDARHGVAVQIPGATFDAALNSCNPQRVHIGDELAVQTGGAFSQVTAAASARRALDSAAGWDPTALRIRRSCASASAPCADMSPRLVALPVFDTDLYDATRGATPTIKVVNFVGFFIDLTGPPLAGNLTLYPGSIDFTHQFIAYKYSLLRTLMLLR